jgi:hypothetical protein
LRPSWLLRGGCWEIAALGSSHQHSREEGRRKEGLVAADHLVQKGVGQGIQGLELVSLLSQHKVQIRKMMSVHLVEAGSTVATAYHLQDGSAV